MPKHQSTAAQSARKDARGGVKYTSALRAREAKTIATPDAHVLQFLAERSGNLYQLVGGIAAALAHSEQRVLVLKEASDSWTWNFGRRGRRKPEPVTPPEPETTPVWASTSGPGTLVTHTCVWETRGPASNRGFPERDRSLLETTVHDARSDYDVIVLLPYRGWAYPNREIATAFVAVGEVDDFPHTDCRVMLPGTLEEQGVPLSPEQCSAVLRERCLSFLFNHLAVPVDGLIWQLNWKLPVDTKYLAAVDCDMDRAGLHTLGWTTQDKPALHQQLPEAHELQDPDFVQPYQQIAARLRRSLDSLPAVMSLAGRSSNS